MSTYTPAIEDLIAKLAKLPGIGKKTAARLAFHILQSSQEDAQALVRSILRVKERIGLCRTCFNIAEGEVCAICRNSQRDHSSLCVVEEPSDLMAIEATGIFKGLYHVLHGAIAPLDGVGPQGLKIAELLERLKQGGVTEVILATNPTIEGDATSLYLAKVVKPLGIMVTRIAQGIPAGGDIEYVDIKTMSRSLEGRREV
ncbi:MAG: recombination protein RecR [Deltaproteobacteria bacterium RBG_16_54_11]|jgi:recombination protein RecR|nr:MAG: recombination protein RecR [Deltaproteobacteria bacterium RBG_16_54_11]